QSQADDGGEGKTAISGQNAQAVAKVVKERLHAALLVLFGQGRRLPVSRLMTITSRTGKGSPMSTQDDFPAATQPKSVNISGWAGNTIRSKQTSGGCDETWLLLLQDLDPDWRGIASDRRRRPKDSRHTQQPAPVGNSKPHPSYTGNRPAYFYLGQSSV